MRKAGGSPRCERRCAASTIAEEAIQLAIKEEAGSDTCIRFQQQQDKQP
jgi:hypothetical protein